MNGKIKNAFIIIIAAMLLILLCTGATLYTPYADATEQEINTDGENADDAANNTFDVEIPEDEPNAAETLDNAPTASDNSIKTQFVTYLKTVYGSDYEYYYNKIIEQWGSVEAYLLAFGDKLPENQQTGWTAFVGWLDKYKVIWSPILAVVIVAIVAVIGKKQFNNIVERIVNGKLSPIVQELNSQTEKQDAQTNASAAIMRALKALMGTNAKFTDSVKELEESEKELTGDE